MTVPTYDRASAVMGVALRVSRLNADGTIKTGADASYVMDRFVTVSYTPVLDGGTTINLQAANGNMLVNYQTKNTLQRVDISLSLAEPDPEFLEMVAAGTIFVDDTIPASPKAVGWGPEAVGIVSNPNGCALEVWSLAIQGGRRASVNPFLEYVFPRVYLDPTGDRAFENAVQAQPFSGYGESNPNFLDGPDSSWDWSSDRPYQFARVATAPTGINGYQAVAP
jgi:hypothetical protein